MAKKSLLTIDGVYRKNKKGFLTIDATYHKIKKAFLTIGSVYRPCWSGGELTYYGTLEPLSESWANHSATTVGQYALFMGGDATRNKAIAYNQSLTRIAVDDLIVSRKSLAATTVGNYAVVGGGNSSDGRFEMYDTSLTHQISTFATPKPRYNLAATTVGNYALFGGGDNSDRVDFCDDSLTFSVAKVLKSPRGGLAAITIGGYAVFAGGGNYSKVVDIYDASVTQLNRSDYLRTSRTEIAAATIGDYALFAGGQTTATAESKVVDAFSASLTRIDTVEDLSVGRTDMMATTLEEFAIFAGGRDNVSTATYNKGFDTVDAYDSSLVRKTDIHPLSEGRGRGAATTLGNFAIFVGGETHSTSTTTVEHKTVDVYTV